MKIAVETVSVISQAGVLTSKRESRIGRCIMDDEFKKRMSPVLCPGLFISIIITVIIKTIYY